MKPAAPIGATGARLSADPDGPPLAAPAPRLLTHGGQPPGPLLPSDPQLWRSTDLDEVRDHGGRIFCAHQLRVRAGGQRLDTRLSWRRFGGLVVGRLSYGADVEIDPQELDGFYLLQWPCQGGETIHQGNERIDSDPGTATLISPGQRFRMQHRAGTEKLFVRIEAAAIRQALEALCPGAGLGEQTPVFAPRLVLGDARLAPITHFLGWLFQEGTAPLMEQPLLAAPAESLLLRLFLSQLPHDQAARLEQLGLGAAAPAPASASPALSPRFVRQAEDYMHAHAHEPLTVETIAARAGVSVRSLYAGFRRHRGLSPMACLRTIRLERARADLLSPSEAAIGVTGVALRWGFGHLGQFSADYRARHGELPSQTLKRTRGF